MQLARVRASFASWSACSASSSVMRRVKVWAMGLGCWGGVTIASWAWAPPANTSSVRMKTARNRRGDSLECRGCMGPSTICRATGSNRRQHLDAAEELEATGGVDLHDAGLGGDERDSLGLDPRRTGRVGED